MIKTAEALRTARGLLGTSYDELDCINLIKKVIHDIIGIDNLPCKLQILSLIHI